MDHLSYCRHTGLAVQLFVGYRMLKWHLACECGASSLSRFVILVRAPGIEPGTDGWKPTILPTKLHPRSYSNAKSEVY